MLLCHFYNITLGCCSVKNKNPADKFGDTPLHHAASNGLPDICRLILEHLAEGNGRSNPVNHKGFTPLHLAAKNGHFQTFQVLFGFAGDKLPTVAGDGWTPLHWAASKCHPDICRLIMENVKFDEVSEQLLLHQVLIIAAGQGDLDIFQMVFDRCRDCPQGNVPKEGWPGVGWPLHAAAQNGRLEICRRIVKSGADVDVINQAGLSFGLNKYIFTAVHRRQLAKDHCNSSFLWLFFAGEQFTFSRNSACASVAQPFTKDGSYFAAILPFLLIL